MSSQKTLLHTELYGAMQITIYIGISKFHSYVVLLLTYLVAFHPRPLKICMLKLVWTTSPQWKYLVMMYGVPGWSTRKQPKNRGQGKI